MFINGNILGPRFRGKPALMNSIPVGNGKEPSVPGPVRLLGFLLKVYRIDLQVFAVLRSSDFYQDLGTRRLGRIA